MGVGRRVFEASTRRLDDYGEQLSTLLASTTTIVMNSTCDTQVFAQRQKLAWVSGFNKRNGKGWLL